MNMRKILFFAMIGIVLVGLVGIVGCGPQTQPGQQEYRFERNDLIMVNSDGTGSYVFFFENNATMGAFYVEVQIKFDTSLEIPVVKAKMVRSDYQNSMVGVTVYFRNRDQMMQYWIVR